MVFGFGSSKTEESTLTNSHTATHGNPVSNTVDALNPSTGTGTHLPPTEQSHNPLSSHNDHVDTAHSSSANPFKHNETVGTGHDHTLAGNRDSSLTGGNHSSTGGVMSALDPRTGTGSHLGPADHSHNPLSSKNDNYDTAHSSNPLSHNNTVGTGHETLGQKAEIKKDEMMGSHTGTGTHNTTGTHATTATHPGTHTGAPTLAEKVKGTVEVLVGKVTGNPAKIAEGEALKTGHAHAAGTTGASPNTLGH